VEKRACRELVLYGIDAPTRVAIAIDRNDEG
jgi:hypothetical protein